LIREYEIGITVSTTEGSCMTVNFEAAYGGGVEFTVYGESFWASSVEAAQRFIRRLEKLRATP
jgi:hypothetical protein